MPSLIHTPPPSWCPPRDSTHLCQAVSTPHCLVKNPQTPNFLILSHMPSCPSLPTHVETSPLLTTYRIAAVGSGGCQYQGHTSPQRNRIISLFGPTAPNIRFAMTKVLQQRLPAVQSQMARNSSNGDWGTTTTSSLSYASYPNGWIEDSAVKNSRKARSQKACHGRLGHKRLGRKRLVRKGLDAERHGRRKLGWERLGRGRLGPKGLECERLGDLVVRDLVVRQTRL